MNNLTRIIEETILCKKTKQDKNGKDYLLLELTNRETIFVFPGKVKQIRWSELKEDGKYEFTVEEGSFGNNLLVDFFEEPDIVI